MVKIYQQAFAHAGAKQVIPDASDPQGFVSNEDGFTTDYELPDTDPNYKPIERAEFNGLMNMVTAALGEIQQFGFAKWQAVDGGWPIGANVNHGGGVWQSLANANTEEPGVGAFWKPIVFDDIGQTTETDLGLVRLATTAQAQALVNDTDALTPAKLASGAKAVLNASGDAPIYACRAWVNFNGTGTVAIRASGNVSSITDNGVGNYTVNLTIPLEDANYSVAAAVHTSADSAGAGRVVEPYSFQAGSFIVQSAASSSGAAADSAIMCLAVFR